MVAHRRFAIIDKEGQPLALQINVHDVEGKIVAFVSFKLIDLGYYEIYGEV